MPARDVLVFLSSTARDLTEHREAVARAINGLDGYKCIRMEDFGARAASAEQFDEEAIKQCDVVVLLLGVIYGSSPPGSDKSYTELEYEAALKYGKPVLAFVASERDFQVPLGLIRSIDSSQFHKAEEFKKRISPKLIWATFSTPDDLAKKVYQALFNWAQKHRPDAIPRRRIQSNLPPKPPIFVGRKVEIARCMEALEPEERGWGVIIDGIGGIGKTALALEVAHRCMEKGRFDIYIWVTAKTSVLTPQGIRQETMAATSLDAFLDEIARRLGERDIPRMGDTLEKQKAVLDALRGRKALLVLDNIETLIAEEREALSAFLRRLPSDCKAIITSRRRTGESALIIRLNGLSFKESSQLMDEVGQRYPRVAKQLERAGESGRRELHELTGGNPLALHWALGLIAERDYTFGQVLERLKDAGWGAELFAFLFREATQGLSPTARKVLSALAYFHTPASLTELAQVTELHHSQVETSLTDLVALSLVNQVGEDEPRYGLHPLTRTYVRAALGETTAGEQVVASLAQVELDAGAGFKVARYWLDYAQRYGGWGKDAYKTFDLLEKAWPSLENVARWLAEQAGVLTEGDISASGRKSEDVTTAAQMLIDMRNALSQFLWFRGFWDEHIHLGIWSYRAARLLGRWRDAGWGAYRAAWIYYSRGQTEEASAWADRCAEAFERGGSRRDRASAIRLRGVIAEQKGDLDEAERLYKQALAEYRSLGEEKGVSIVLNDLGGIYRRRKDYDAAEKAYREALEIGRKIGDKEGIAILLGNLASLALDRSRWAKAKEMAEEALELAREVGRRDLIASDLHTIARALEEMGQYEEALPLAEEALNIQERLRHRDVEETRALVERLRRKVP